MKLQEERILLNMAKRARKAARRAKKAKKLVFPSDFR